MPLDAEELSQRLKKLSNSLQGFPKNPTVDEVHALRTRARRLESVLEALEMDSAGNEKKLLADLKSIRSRRATPPAQAFAAKHGLSGKRVCQQKGRPAT